MAPQEHGDRIERLVALLGSEEFAEREAATEALAEAGAEALPALRRALTSDDVEVRRRAADLVRVIDARIAQRQRERAVASVKAWRGAIYEDNRGLERVVVGVDYTTTRVTDAGLELVGWLRDLDELQLSDTAITDKGLAHLRGLERLTILEIHATGVTDAGFAQLKGMRRLRILGAGDTKVTDAGLAHLSAMENLQILDLSRTAVTDAGLARLKKLVVCHTSDLGWLALAVSRIIAATTHGCPDEIETASSQVTCVTDH